MKTFLFRSMMGIFFGTFLAVVITNCTVYLGGKELLDGEIFFKNSLGSIFCGWFFTVSPLYFELKNLRLSQQTALHFMTVTILYFSLSFWIGWIPLHLKSILFFSGMFLTTYAIIWLSFYFYFKNVAKKLNQDLENI
ncbi:DUF3021 domain-containing protein [Alteribacillus sp. YIM 98480]|uniref:DUF3021 domain-containing protein n=1 Tax=Alteribacillus sp. YIM 98480 TaxID=2606599 RepID=UPI00131D7015|nr:DUF3021 domain-containing protein [Alteribacillus sp. YIM 98480]